jgi:hypothetical protein
MSGGGRICSGPLFLDGVYDMGGPRPTRRAFSHFWPEVRPRRRSLIGAGSRSSCATPMTMRLTHLRYPLCSSRPQTGQKRLLHSQEPRAVRGSSPDEPIYANGYRKKLTLCKVP